MTKLGSHVKCSLCGVEKIIYFCYFCDLCKMDHYLNSQIGKSHRKFEHKHEWLEI